MTWSEILSVALGLFGATVGLASALATLLYREVIGELKRRVTSAEAKAELLKSTVDKLESKHDSHGEAVAEFRRSLEKLDDRVDAGFKEVHRLLRGSEMDPVERVPMPRRSDR